jgi:heptaprenyl diphosphate synthase
MWSDDVAIAAGDYLFATAFDILAKHDMRAVETMIKAALNLSLGELDQIETAHVVDQTMDDYLRKARRKTAALFAACCRAGSMLAGAPQEEVEALTKYGDYLGIAFQIYDDVLDIAGGVSTGKAVGVDVRDGTVTVPILYALDHYGRDSDFSDTIGKSSLSDEEVNTAIKLVRDCGAVDKTKNTARSYVDLAFEAISILPDPNNSAMFRGIGEFVIARYH